MSLLKFELKKIFSIYQITDSYHFNDKHNADSYLKTIVQILSEHDFLQGTKLSEYNLYDDTFHATFDRINPLGVDIECRIDFNITTLTIAIKK